MIRRDGEIGEKGVRGVRDQCRARSCGLLNSVKSAAGVVFTGESPPCMQKIFSSMSAATGRQLKQSVKVFQILMLYRRLPARSASVGQNIIPYPGGPESGREGMGTHIRRRSHKFC